MNALGIQILAALLTPAVAIAGAGLATLNYLHALRRRKDELFDRRYEFYKNLRDWWLHTGTWTPEGHDPEITAEDLIPMAEEARFLFGDDVVRHIMSFEGNGHTGSPFFPDESFVKPFVRYLKL